MATLAHDSPVYARRLGLRYSAGIHLSLILLAVFGLPTLFEWTREPEPTAITVEIVPVGPISNIKPQQEAEKKPDEMPDTSTNPTPMVKTEEKAEEKEKPVTPTKSEQATPLEESPDKKEKKEEKKKEEVKKEKPKEDDLEAVLKSVEQAAQKQNNPAEKTEEGASPTKAKSDVYDPTMPLSISEEDLIRSQIEKNWSPPIGAKDSYDLKVLLRISMNLDGTVTGVEVEDSSRYVSDPLFRAAADSAMRAVWLASPLTGLSPEKYSTWRELRFNFDPREALY